MSEENLSGLDWNALLQKTEECVIKCEDFYTRDEPMTGIEKMRGVEHAYYEASKMLEEAESRLRNTKVTPTRPIEMEEEEAPKDPASVRQALDKSLADAGDLVKNLESFMEKVDTLDMKDIDNILEQAATVMSLINLAKEGFAETSGEGGDEGKLGKVPSQPAVLWSLTEPPKTEGEEE